MDFFTLDTILGKRFYIFFIIYLQTRQIVRYAVTTNPTRQLVRHQLIEFTWYLEGKRIYLVHDGSGEFCNINYDDFGIEEIRISANAPNMNAFAERFIGSVRREAFDWFILFNEGQIRNILVEYVGYYNEKRPHQGIAQKVPKGYTPQKRGNIITYPILSGLHHNRAGQIFFRLTACFGCCFLQIDERAPQFSGNLLGMRLHNKANSRNV